MGGQSCPGLWPTAVAQAEVAAENAVGGDRPTRASSPVTILKVVGIELASIGRIHAEPGDEAIVHEDATAAATASSLIADGRIVGAILLGPGNDVAAVRTAITRGFDVTPELRACARAASTAWPSSAAARSCPPPRPRRNTGCMPGV